MMTCTAAMPLVEEEEVSLFVNHHPVKRFLCTPEALGELAAGHLLLKEGLKSPASLTIESIDEERLEIHATLRPEWPGDPLPCPGKERVISRLDLPDTDVLRNLAVLMFERAVKYKTHRGIHCGALSDGREITSFYEDVGRHNVLDKVIGDAFLKGTPLDSLIYFTSGRVSSTIAEKAAACGIPCIVARSLPTTRALAIAEENGLGIIGRIESASPLIYRLPGKDRK